jgi:uncharacterized protein (TIGR02147 family)
MLVSKEIFEFRSYKDFLHSRVGPPKSRHGLRIAMAKKLRCQPTYVSQVLNGRAHLSLEQGEALSDFFGLTSDQRHYFLLLIQWERAGTPSLASYFKEQLEEIKTRRLILTARLGGENKLSKEHQSIYYSSWHYAAIHMALTIPQLRSPRALAKALGLSLKRVSEVAEFLCSAGLAQKKGELLETGTNQIRLGKESHNILKHHTNWRHQAIDSLDRETLADLHYSGVVTLSREDVLKLKNRILEFIQESVKTVRESKEEELYCLAVDFFSLLRSGE